MATNWNFSEIFLLSLQKPTFASNAPKYRRANILATWSQVTEPVVSHTSLCLYKLGGGVSSTCDQYGSPGSALDQDSSTFTTGDVHWTLIGSVYRCAVFHTNSHTPAQVVPSAPSDSVVLTAL